MDPGNPIQNLTSGLDQTVTDATGIPSDVSGATEPVTDLLDETVTNITGQDLGSTVDGLTNPDGQGGSGGGLLP